MELNADTDHRLPPSRPGRTRGRAGWVAILLVVAAFAAAFFFGIVPRRHALEALSQETRALGVPTVAVTAAAPGEATSDLVLPGNLQAYAETSVHARASGYLRRWTADIGARVRKGDVLAEIEIPEVEAELQQARADYATARVNFEQAEITSRRWQELAKTGTVSAQEAEVAFNTMRARRASLESARQSVVRVERMQSFRRVYSPFTGIVTARNAEVGELVDAGAAGGPGRELFRISATDRLRVRVNVPQTHARDAVPGTVAELTLPERPGKTFSGKLVRTAESIDASSRTLLAEVEVDNQDGQLLPGAYAQVHLRLQTAANALVVPINTLLFRAEGPQVATVGPDQKVMLKSVTIGRDFGTKLEILAGMAPEDRLVLNPSDSIVSGTQVRVVTPPAPAEGGKKSGPAEGGKK